ncbi:MAG: peptidoglycan DD-metalloendopeptidase family protein [Candidatus Krumholzibacteria bacterium]
MIKPRFHVVVIATALLLLGASADPSFMDLGRRHCALFFGGELDKIWQNFSPEMKNALGSENNLRAFYEQTREQLGKETATIAETVEEVGALSVYLRTARFEKLDQLIHVQWAFDKKGVVAGFYIRPVQTEAPSKYLDYETRTKLELPFEGKWFVVWGGRTIAENYHAFTVDQRFAYDILMMKDGSTHAGDGKRNQDFYCFGERILAPGAGLVVVMENGVEDNIPGVMNPKQALGNHVILDHGSGEYSFLAHFKKGTVAVEKGQRVVTGDLLGLCGNSGNSSEPHLHCHLQNTPAFGLGEGLPAQFQGYLADGKPVSRGEPVKGQAIRRGQ